MNADRLTDKQKKEKYVSFLSEVSSQPEPTIIFISENQVLNQKIKKIKLHLLLHAVLILATSLSISFATFHSYYLFPLVSPECKMAFFVSFYLSISCNLTHIIVLLRNRAQLESLNDAELRRMFGSRLTIILRNLGRICLNLLLFKVKCEQCGANLFNDVKIILAMHLGHLVIGMMLELNLENTKIAEVDKSLSLDNKDKNRDQNKANESLDLNNSNDIGTTNDSFKYSERLNENSQDILEGLRVIKSVDNDDINKSSPTKCLMGEFQKTVEPL